MNFSSFHQSNFEKWLGARHPHVDTQTIDFNSMWDSSLTVKENYNQIEQQLLELGYGNFSYSKREYNDWNERANEWYQNELGKLPEYNELDNDFLTLDENAYCIGFQKEETAYVIPHYEFNRVLENIENRIYELEKLR